MFLLEPGETLYDLRWTMFGVDIRVHPMFWLLSALMGFSFLEAGFAYFLVWMVCVFFSILIHELGHVFMFRACGTSAHVVLYAFGGLAVPHHRLHNRWQRIMVSFAGPFAELLIIVAIAVILAIQNPLNVQAVVGMVLATFGIRSEDRVLLELPHLLTVAVIILVEINLFWALLNLLPIFPLDGGHISRDLLDGAVPGGQGTRVALIISLVVAAILAIHALVGERGSRLIPFLPPLGAYAAIMFAMLAVQSFQMLQEQSNPPWRREG